MSTRIQGLLREVDGATELAFSAPVVPVTWIQTDEAFYLEKQGWNETHFQGSRNGATLTMARPLFRLEPQQVTLEFNLEVQQRLWDNLDGRLSREGGKRGFDLLPTLLVRVEEPERNIHGRIYPNGTPSSNFLRKNLQEDGDSFDVGEVSDVITAEEERAIHTLYGDLATASSVILRPVED